MAEAAVTHELGAAVRSQLYRVAASPRLTPRDRMVLEVCRVYGRVQPGTALTRLRHIADKAPGEWAENLVRALAEIASEPGNLALVLVLVLVLVLERVSGWADGGGGSADVAAAALLRLLHGDQDMPDVPAELERGGLAPEPVASAWAASSRSGHAVRPVLWSWLDALARHGRGDGAAATSLLGAAARDPGLADELGRCARRWSYAHTRASPAVEALRRSLDQILRRKPCFVNCSRR
ncbi:hypothetical protein [Nocardiopsis sp. FR6]|uniref:hypothetical protein n=1 Tax=Nocardiopsis sp. FR6 TaxID=2605986 RepID=UPI00135875D8|nr:hypothetical protein [Nocardiopsis sp. FR6]